ncbi:serine palmitoyltransferase [Ceraceosorus bombacis]|uniref:serine C-palmitoyltransferase n=1 Tax=Ceraceosorus bombacis TaxID=401625 RepID=A0A0N7LAT6_9BASI|nr:serine palmitoyltransferase [Ceraceosorus bombacis]
MDQMRALAAQAESIAHRIPGSAIVARYVRSSYQDDPFRSLLELILLAFALRTLLQSRTRGNQSGSNFVKLSEREIDELVSEFNPEPLVAPLSAIEKEELDSVPTISGGLSSKPKVLLPARIGGSAKGAKEMLNLASYNFAGLAGSDIIRDAAVDTLREYGVGSCSPPGFYGTIDVHMTLEQDLARFLGVESAIIYSQGFSTISSVIPCYLKRGDVIVADKGVNFAIQKGIQASRSFVRWYEHNSLSSLESVLADVTKHDKRRRGRLTRRFIITEGIFEGDGAAVDLKAICDLKKKYKFRLILDEGISFGTAGKSGKGMTELCGVNPNEVDILCGSMSNTLGAAGGFCAGAATMTEHQRINAASFVYSAAMPAMLAVAGSTCMQYLQAHPDVLERLRSNIATIRSTLNPIESIVIVSDAASPLIHVQVRSQADPHPASPKGNASLSVPQELVLGHDLTGLEQARLLQLIVDEGLRNGVLLTRHKTLPSINAKALESGAHARPCIRIAVTAGLTQKEIEKAAGVIKNAVVKVLGKRR